MVDTITIDKTIPLGPPKASAHAIPYPLAAMSVGDSFAIPAGERNDRGVYPARVRLSAAIVFFSRKSGMKFATRCIQEDGVTVVRVWRVA